MDAERYRRIPLFQHLSAEARLRMLAKAALHHARRGAVIFEQGRRAEAAWLVLDGWVHLVRRHPGRDAARQVVIATITPEDLLCGVSAIEAATYTATGIAGAHAKLLRIPAKTFNETLVQEPAFATAVLDLCAQRIRRLVQRVGTLADPVPRRIANVLLQLRDQFGPTIPMTHRELAGMAWTTTESAIRAVGEFKRRGWVGGTRGRLTIRRRQPLEQLAANGYDAGHRPFGRCVRS